MQNIIFYFLLDCECLAPSFMGPPHPKHTPTPSAAQVYCVPPGRRRSQGEQKWREGEDQPSAAARSALRALTSPLCLPGGGGLVQTILREGKARLRFSFLGELFSFLFFKFLLEFCLLANSV